LPVIIDTAADKLISEMQREAEELSNEYGGSVLDFLSIYILSLRAADTKLATLLPQ
jgi:hypothetical protein